VTRSSIAKLRPVLSPLKRLWKKVRGEFRDYLGYCHGVIHVGAHTGQERETYAHRGLSVVWIEPIPQVYEQLMLNIAPFPNQCAIKALITDKDGDNCDLHFASNDGVSSSIFDLHMHRDIWPEISYLHDIAVRSATLPSTLANAGVNPEDYDALVIDAEGSELLILRGSESLIRRFKYIEVEAADFESYRGGPTMKQIIQFLSERGFRLARKQPFAKRREGGTYFDLLFKRRAP
jgi:FkbM family methyltransferase